MKGHDYYTVHPHRDEADLDLEGNGDALALHARLRNIAFLDGGKLPLDPEHARKRARVSGALWRRAWPLVSKKWRASDDGAALVNDELLTEFDRVRVYLERCAAGGRKGAPQRWPETQGKTADEGSGGEQVPDTSCQEGNGLDRIGSDRNGPEGSAPSAPGAVSSNEGTGSRGPSPEPTKARGAKPNPHGIRLAKDGASCCFRGNWYHPAGDGKRWLTEDSTRPDGTSTMNGAKDVALNESVWKAMNEAVA